MEEKRFLKVSGKAIENGKTVSEAVAIVPYIKGGSVKLPDIPPFNTNVRLSGDDGYNMMWIEFTSEGKVCYFYNDYYEFKDGKIHAEKKIKGMDMVFDFELTEMPKNADYAIALKVRRVEPNEEIDEMCSKFFGAPGLPRHMIDRYPDDAVFFAQICCSDLKELDPDNRLPHDGYLYFFLDAKMHPSEQLFMTVDHTYEEPTQVIDDYNLESPISEGLNDSYVITFEKVDADYDGTKLLGHPSNDVDDGDDRGELLLQYDPLDFDVPFLSSIDGYAFVFFGKTMENRYDGADFVVWRS